MSTRAPNGQPPCGFTQSACACGGAPLNWASPPASFVIVTVQVEPVTTTVACPGVGEAPQKQTVDPSLAVTTQQVLRGGKDAAPVQESAPTERARPNSAGMLVLIADHLAPWSSGSPRLSPEPREACLSVSLFPARFARTRGAMDLRWAFWRSGSSSTEAKAASTRGGPMEIGNGYESWVDYQVSLGRGSRPTSTGAVSAAWVGVRIFFSAVPKHS